MKRLTGYLLAAVTGAVLALTVAPYDHPCVEDEYVQVDGACVHVDVLSGEADR